MAQEERPFKPQVEWLPEFKKLPCQTCLFPFTFIRRNRILPARTSKVSVSFLTSSNSAMAHLQKRRKATEIPGFLKGDPDTWKMLCTFCVWGRDGKPWPIFPNSRVCNCDRIEFEMYMNDMEGCYIPSIPLWG